MAEFEVVGGHAVRGVAPGGIVEIEDADHASYLIAAGHLAPVKGTRKASKKQPGNSSPAEGQNESE